VPWQGSVVVSQGEFQRAYDNQNVAHWGILTSRLTRWSVSMPVAGLTACCPFTGTVAMRGVPPAVIRHAG
jgi:hypothetical protein